jgi:hypothetical protein
MSFDWRYEVEVALRRAKKSDLGATAAREGILGLPLTVCGTKASRVYQKASDARSARNAALKSRGKSPLVPGRTNYPDLDQQFTEQN